MDDVEYVYDTSLYAIVNVGETSRMQQADDEAKNWAVANNMRLNASKTKEIVIFFGRSNINIPKIEVECEDIERVSDGKLLGVNILKKLDWDYHVTAMCKKASK